MKRAVILLVLLTILSFALYGFSSKPPPPFWPEQVFHRPASDLFDAIHYRADGGLLTLCFRRGQVYEYEGVPADLYQRMMQTARHGEFYNQQIRGRFASRRVLLNTPGEAL